MTDYTISTETEAFALLEQLLAGLDLDGATVRFEGWPKFVIVIRGEDFDGTIPTRIMPALLELQSQVHRLFATTVYGEANLRRLSREDKSALELVVRLQKGSSIFETLLNEPLTKTCLAALDKMTGTQLTIIVIAFGILATSYLSWKAWTAKRVRERELDQEIQMKRLENERIELIAKAVRQEPAIEALASGMDAVRETLARRLAQEDEMEVGGEEAAQIGGTPLRLEGSMARQIVRAPRETAAERIVEGEYQLRAADFAKPGVVRVELQRLSDAYLFRANVPGGVLTNDQEALLRDRGWRREPLTLQLLVNELHGRYTSAKVIAVQGLEAAPLGGDG